jgi:hypothetical protein
MKNIIEEIIKDGSLPIFQKLKDEICYVYHPSKDKHSVCFELNKFMIPYYRVNKKEIITWLTNIEFEIKVKNLKNLKEYKKTLLTYFDQDGGEPRYGGAFYLV